MIACTWWLVEDCFGGWSGSVAGQGTAALPRLIPVVRIFSSSVWKVVWHEQTEEWEGLLKYHGLVAAGGW